MKKMKLKTIKVIVLSMTILSVIMMNGCANNQSNNKSSDDNEVIMDKDNSTINEENNVDEEENEIGSGEYTAITKRMDLSLEGLGDRQSQVEKLFKHSFLMIDAYRVGISESDEEGCFSIDPEEFNNMLQEDYDEFKELFESELAQIEELGVGVEEENYIEGRVTNPFSGENGDLLAIVWEVNKAYYSGIKEVTNNSDIVLTHTLSTNTKIEETRDVLQRYWFYLFGGKFEVEGLVEN